VSWITDDCETNGEVPAPWVFWWFGGLVILDIVAAMLCIWCVSKPEKGPISNSHNLQQWHARWSSQSQVSVSCRMVSGAECGHNLADAVTFSRSIWWWCE